jgi:hypothetical protein
MKTLTRSPLVTSHQLAIFWRLFRDAWTAECRRTGTPPNLKGAADTWRHRILLEEGGTQSIKTLRKDKFDDVMLRLAVEAGDEKEISYWSSAVERRYRYLIEQCLHAMAKLDSSQTYNWQYVVNCYRRAKLPLDIQNAPAEHLQKALQMLDTHRRRLIDRMVSEVPF